VTAGRALWPRRSTADGAGRRLLLERFVLPRPLLQAIQSDDRVVLLIDEIDKADAEFEAFLLEILSDFQVTVPEIGTIEAKRIPIVVLTSNNAREMSTRSSAGASSLHRLPEQELELEIVGLKVPDVHERIANEVVELIHAVRKLDLKKQPSISETLDWAKALTVMNVDTLGDELVRDTLSTICKYEGDVRKAEKELEQFVQKKRAEQPAAPAQAAKTGGDKDLLH
jgi:MoxR-like ATPase